MRPLNRLFAALALAAGTLPALQAAAQVPPPAPRLVLNVRYTGGAGVFRYDRLSNLWTGIAQLPANTTFSDITMAENNYDYMLGSRWSSGLRFLNRIQPNGTINTVQALGSGTDLTDVMYRAGTYTVTTFDNFFYRWDTRSNTTNTVDVGYSQSGVTDDYEVSHVAVSMCSLGFTYRIRYNDSQASTIIDSQARGSDIEYNPQWGSYLLTTQDAIIRAERNGSLNTLATVSGWPKPTAVDPETGNSVVGAGSKLYNFDRNGTNIGIDDLGLRGVYAVEGVTFEGSRKVSTDSDTGRSRNINLSFPNSANRYYNVALSFSTRPGIPAGGGRRVLLNPDPLFAVSLRDLPGITSNFSGMLDGFGQATANFLFPQGTPSGTSVFASAVAINPTQPNNLDTANTMILTY